MDVVVLAGTIGHEAHWARGVPRPLLPLPDTTIIDALLGRLHQAFDGVHMLCANGHTALIENHVSGAGGTCHNLAFFEDAVPLGPAGCLKACEPNLRGDLIFVTGASVWLEEDPRWMVEQHRAQGNALTVYCTAVAGRGRGGAEPTLTPTGLYCCDRVVLDHITPVGFQDIKEQLVPALRRNGHRVGVVTLRKPAFEVSDWVAYLRAIARCLATERLELRGYRQIAPEVWCGEGVEIAARARIVGPAFLGHRCRIADDALVVGPAILGDECRVDRGCWVVKVVALSGTRFEGGVAATDRFLGSYRDRDQTLDGRSDRRNMEAGTIEGWLSRASAPRASQRLVDPRWTAW